MRNLLVFDIGNARVVTVDDDHVFYTDEFLKGGDLECDDEVVSTVVAMWNEGYLLMEIDDFLLNSEKLTQDAREHIMEALCPLS